MTLPSPTRASVTPPLAGEAMAALGPHPALRATFPVSGEGFDGGDGLPHQCAHWFAMTGVGRCGRRAIAPMVGKENRRNKNQRFFLYFSNILSGQLFAALLHLCWDCIDTLTIICKTERRIDP